MGGGHRRTAHGAGGLQRRSGNIRAKLDFSCKQWKKYSGKRLQPIPPPPQKKKKKKKKRSSSRGGAAPYPPPRIRTYGNFGAKTKGFDAL